MSRLSKNVLIGLVTVVVAFAALFYVRKRFAVPDKFEIPVSNANREPEWPPGEPAPIKFAAPNMSSAERREFLNADYRIVGKVADLPAGIRKLYMVKGGSRVAIADPGEKFEATDVITDPDLPSRRLIFAGVAQDRAFIHYEEGGIVHSHMVELFRLESPDIAVGLWSAYCGPAKSLEEIKQLVLGEDRDSCRTVAQLQSEIEVNRQNVDQLCGSLRFAAPKTKTITTADGKVEKRLYANVLNEADVELYKATRYEKCCDGKTPAGRTKSDKFGRFQLPGFQSGWYWLHIQSKNFTTTMPLHVTSDFNDKSCRDLSVGRIFTVDAQPPQVETRIY
jgi:hypothetical protein